MITIHPSNKSTGKNVYMQLDEIKNLAHLINWKKLVKYIDSNSIDMKFMTELDSILHKHDIRNAIIKKSSNLDVIKLLQSARHIIIDYKDKIDVEISQEFILYYKDRITDWTFLRDQKSDKILKPFIEEIYPFLKLDDTNEGDYYAKRNRQLFLDIIIQNHNLPVDFLEKYKTPELEELYRKNYPKKGSYYSYNYKTPSINFLRVYKDSTDWELLMKYAPSKIFNKNFVVEFYQYIAPLCITLSGEIDQKKIDKITKFRKYIKK